MHRYSDSRGELCDAGLTVKRAGRLERGPQLRALVGFRGGPRFGAWSPHEGSEGCSNSSFRGSEASYPLSLAPVYVQAKH